MSVILDGDVVRLCGDCLAEEAEKLLELLQAGPDRRIDLGEALHLHAAVLQVLLALRPEVAGPAREPFISRWLEPILTRSGRSPSLEPLA